MSEFPRPRLEPAVKRQIVRQIVECRDEATAARIAETLWAKLRGDMQDRITTLIYAARSAVTAKDMETRRSNLRRAVRDLSDTEVAASR